MDVLAPYVVAFSDDGKGVQNEEIMLAAMKRQKNFTRLLLLTAKTTVLSRWDIHDGNYADRPFPARNMQ